MLDHIPVMLNETLHYLNITKGNFAVDATFGAGGHSLEILKIIGSQGKLFAFEKDEKSYKNGIYNFKKFKNFKLFNTSYSNIYEYLPEHKGKIDAILFDLGVSSMQFDDANRGFSFSNNGPLDMRFSKKQPITAEYIVNNYDYKNLKHIFFKYGEEKFSNKIAKYICKEREINPIKTTKQLADLIKKILPSDDYKKHPATRVFQALRIEVNDELKTVEIGIKKAVNFLKKGGRIVVISFHSLEDRIVKNIFKQYAATCTCPPNFPVCVCKQKQTLKIITKKPIYSKEAEIKKNKRARSAILRVAEKL
jgi:16S rRNA (cytosine1402-N4)-methyltransferase